MNNKFYKKVEDGYICELGFSIGVPEGYVEITEAEYDSIMEVFKHMPTKDGSGFRLKSDLTWEEFVCEPEVSYEELAMTAYINSELALALLENGE